MSAFRSESSPGEEGWRPDLLFSVAMFGIFAGYLSGLAMMLGRRAWILAPGGRPIPCDFLAYWTAGHAALAGRAAAAYVPNTLHAMQIAAAGPFPDYLYWNYPPLFLLVAAALACMPYLASFLGWIISTGTAYAIVIGAISRRWAGLLGACASPVVLLTAFSGQNGFLSAALLGGFLLLLPMRPIVSGVLLGLLTYKPQFGILLPIVLICGCHLRALCAATATAVFIAAISLAAFGADTYVAFMHSLTVISNSSLTLGGEGWGKMQSVYAIARVLGAGDDAAWSAQAGIIVACAAAMIWLWRSNVADELKAASLAAAAMLSTPYLHVYDFPVFIVALAFLYRQRQFDRLEWTAVVAVNLLMVTFLAQPEPIGPVIAIIVGALILRRIQYTRSTVMSGPS